jgi:chaperonin GroEL (HSP60 family)
LPDVITALTTDSQVAAYLNQHCIFMSSPRQQGERTMTVGTAAGTTPTGVQSVARALNSELAVLSYPDTYVITVTDQLGNTVGEMLLANALIEPFNVINANAGNKAEYKEDIGFNAKTGEYEDLIQAGVIDSAKVVEYAIKNAVSVVGTLLTTEALILNYEETPIKQ